MTAEKLKKELRKYASRERKKANEWFFKSGIGQYGEGDQFIGVRVPDCRKVAQQFKGLPLNEIEKVLESKIHEERLTVILILVDQFKKAQKTELLKKISGANTSTLDSAGVIYNFYLKHTKHINNWDLVDLSAHRIVGGYLLQCPKSERKILYKLAKSKNLWEQRISVISTFAFIPKNDFEDPFKLADMLLIHPHDLIHKAVGWMLREIGKRDQKAEEKYLF